MGSKSDSKTTPLPAPASAAPQVVISTPRPLREDAHSGSERLIGARGSRKGRGAAWRGARRPGLCFDACCCCMCHGFRLPDENHCCKNACFMLNERERCEICPCKCCQCDCADTLCVLQRLTFIVVSVMIVVAVIGWIAFMSETEREERVEMVLCLRNSTFPAPGASSLEVWDAKLHDKTIWSVFRSERGHANFTLQLFGPLPSSPAGFIFAQNQIIMEVQPVHCAGGRQFLVISPELNSTISLSGEFSPLAVTEEGFPFGL